MMNTIGAIVAFIFVLLIFAAIHKLIINGTNHSTQQSDSRENKSLGNEIKANDGQSTDEIGSLNARTIRFCCNHCFVMLTASGQYISSERTCPQCNYQIQVPSESAKLIAEKLLSITRSFSTISITSLDEKIPEFWELTSEEDWVFFSSSAIISSCLLLEENGELRAWRIESILDQFLEVDPHFGTAIKDFTTTWLKIRDEIDIDEHISMWLLTNLKGEQPSIPEIQKHSKWLGPFTLQQASSLQYSLPEVL